MSRLPISKLSRVLFIKVRHMEIFVKIGTGGVPIEISVLSARPLIFTLHFELDKNGRTINHGAVTFV